MFKFLFILTLNFVIIYGLNTVTNDYPVVRTRIGDIRGSRMQTRNGVWINSFRGIIYANHERFKPSTPIRRYSGLFDATSEGPACPFPTEFTSVLRDEDCLRLNVYTPQLPRGRRSSKLPVLFYIHPGGWYSLSGQSNIVGPQYLLDYPIVLVTINYRLGSLGFLSTGTKEAPGNLGLKDQVEALRWVQKHIIHFGGDPDQVTIMGYSAGSISVGLHMISPMTRGLFHRAIAMSGSATGNWDIPGDQLNLAKKQARLVNCSDSSPAVIVSCLKTKDAMEIANTLVGFTEFDYDPVLIFVPVVEPDFGQERYLVENPVESINKGDIADVAFLTGMTDLEFAYRAYYVLTNQTLVDQLNTKWEDIAPIIFAYERNTERSRTISTELRKEFIHDKPLRNDGESKRNLGDIYSDGLIGFGVHRFLHRIADKLTSPIFYYKFTYSGRYSNFHLPGTNDTIGPIHHDDLLYLFAATIAFPQITKSEPENLTVERMTKMWTNFIISGNPTPKKEQVLENSLWPLYSNGKEDYLEIGQHLEVKQCLFCDRFNVWDRLFPIDQKF